jgi:hypothetical protein
MSFDATPLSPSIPEILDGILLEISQMPMKGQALIFGSCATDKVNPGDVDVWLDMRELTLDEFKACKGFASVKPLLDLARQHYGLLDPFIRFQDDVLVVRNDEATGWTMAKNARALVRSMDESSCSLQQAFGFREQTKASALGRAKRSMP